MGAFVLILPAQTFYERINFDLGTVLEQVWLGERVAIPKDQLDPPPMTIDPAKIYTATLHTELGEVVIELLADRAPITVNNFVFLSRIGFYDGTTFHRVIPGFVAQGGDPSGTGTGGPGYTIPDEFTDLTHERGVISMANIGQPDTGGSQFFITYASLPHLDGSNTIFGRVITGMEVVEALTPRDPNQQPDFVGTTLHRVVIEERVPEPARIAFHSDRDGDPEIYVMDANGGNVTQLTFDSGFYGNAVWSPDGRQIAFESDRDGDFEIYVMDADGGNVTQLTFNSARDRLPTWSADGEEIAFDSDRDGDFEIYVMDVDGSNVRQLTSNSAPDRLPTWSPDGRQIAFYSNRDGDFEIYVMDADGSNVRQLTSNSTVDVGPTWSPDGEEIAFDSDRDGDFEIYVMDADGSNVTQLTFNEAIDVGADWSQSGR